MVRDRPKLKRSNGVHLSGVIKYVLTTSGMLTPDDITDEMPLRMCVGMAWEDWAVGLWPEMEWQPGECLLDGISGSPDGLSESRAEEIPRFQSGGMSKSSRAGQNIYKGVSIGIKHNRAIGARLEEFKATWKSSFPRQDITKERIWMWQMAGYCKMMGLSEARLHVLWINGDYRPPSPKYMTYTLRFTQEELDRFWTNVILKNKESATPETHA